ncbi:MAG TPA: glycosyltransferase family 39 protein [Patescibacteria group bacterium]|nr:glycosyltransferase family 39 protein [Patescibacteria group bacterium]
MSEPRQGRRGDLVALAGLGLAYWVAHLLVINRYGWFRDELYYIACSKRLAWGYVDHPPFSIAALAIIRGLFGDSLPAVRFVPGLLGAACIFMTGLMARSMGAARRGQILAAVGVAVAPVFLFTTHIYSMNAFDLVFWTLCALLLVRIVQTGDQRLWILLGAAFGVGLLNKISLLWLGGGMGVGLLLTPARRTLATRWPWLAGALAFVIFLPHVIWQAATGWPTLEFMRNATAHKMADVSYAEFLRMQLNALNPFALPLWLGGFLFCMFGRQGRPWRILGWVFLVIFLFLMVSGKARASYLSPAFPMMLAAGGVAFDRWFEKRGWRLVVPLYLVLLLAGGAIAAPFTLPVLPVETFIAYSARLGVAPHQEEHSRLGLLPQHYADMFGWEELAATVARVYDGLDEADRKRCVIFAQNYGEAGAIELFGGRYGLPPVVSNHNNYWLWGPRDSSGDLVIVVGGDRSDEEADFNEVSQAGLFECRYCMPYEDGLTIWVGRGLKTDLRELWPKMKNYN